VKALVTGASSGIGAKLAERLAARGYETWVAARRRAALDEVVADIGAHGGRAHAFVLDVSQPEAAEARVAELDREVGGFDLVIANAGIGEAATPVSELALADVRRFVETNLMGALATLLPSMRSMVARKSGHLVGISSLAAEIAMPVAAAYGTSKAALSFFLQSAALDLASHGVSVTDVHPGFVRTPLTDKNTFKMPFMVELDDAVKIIDRGIAQKKRVVRFPLALTSAISGSSVLPHGLKRAIMNKNRPR
jgi:short-subunit dehydrogenase